jgi:hypothetical protein
MNLLIQFVLFSILFCYQLFVEVVDDVVDFDDDLVISDETLLESSGIFDILLPSSVEVAANLIH